MNLTLDLPETGRILVVGAAVLDRIFYVDKLPQRGETAIGTHVEVHPGGKGANQALAARKMGAEVSFLSAVGEDEAARVVLKPLSNVGIDTSNAIHIPEVQTAEAIIAVDKRGENLITAFPGAYYHLTGAMLEERRDAFKNSGWLLIQNELPDDTVHRAIAIAVEEELRVIFNPAPFVHGSPLPPRDLFMIIANEVEAAGLLGVEDYFSITPAERAGAWRSLGAQNVVVTLGRNGCEWFDKTNHRRDFPAVEVKAVDTVGAGDAFCGILIAMLADGIDIETAIGYANAGAALSVTRRGAQSGLPNREELENFHK